MKERSFGIFKQIAILVTIVILAVGFLTYAVNYRLSEQSVKRQTAEFAESISHEVIQSITQYPAYEWLIKYWYDHANTLVVEYDVDYKSSVKSKNKYAEIIENNPDFRGDYATVEEVEALSLSDQRKYAEIVYSWVTTSFNRIKRTYNIDYLFCVVTDTDEGEKPYQEQLFLFSGADEGARRGKDYLEVYPLGMMVSVAENESQQSVMRHAVERGQAAEDGGTYITPYIYELAAAGDYMDYYEYLDSMEDKAVLIGLTYNLSSLKENIRRQTWKGTVYSVLFQFLLLLGVMLLTAYFEIQPLKKILTNIRLYTESKDSAEITTNINEIMAGPSSLGIRNNEIGELAQDVIELAREIDDYAEQIETAAAASERISAELSLAANIQSNMLPAEFPPFPDKKEFDLYASMDPAREVGGDFYDFFLIDDDHLAVVIADVSGKGIPAALFMMASQINIRNMALRYKNPGEALEAANNEVCRNNVAQMFVTVWLGVLELSTGKLTAANAGHEYPALKSGNGNFELYKDKHGFVLGGMEGMKYKEYEIMMEPGSKIFVYTDGVPEATHGSSELFGTDRMLESLNQDPHATPEDILKNVRKSVDDFVLDTEQFDDLTMLCLQYNGRQ